VGNEDDTRGSIEVRILEAIRVGDLKIACRSNESAISTRMHLVHQVLWRYLDGMLIQWRHHHVRIDDFSIDLLGGLATILFGVPVVLLASPTATTEAHNQ